MVEDCVKFLLRNKSLFLDEFVCGLNECLKSWKHKWFK